MQEKKKGHRTIKKMTEGVNGKYASDFEIDDASGETHNPSDFMVISLIKDFN